MFRNFSSNPSVATVDSNGVVTGLKEGTATITVTVTLNGKSASGSRGLIVNEVTDIKVTPKIAAVYKDYSYKKVDFNTPTYTVSPSGLSVPNPNDFTWSPSVASASSYPDGVGTQTLNFTKLIYGNSIDDSYTLKVVDKEWSDDLVDGLSLTLTAETSKKIKNGKVASWDKYNISLDRNLGGFSTPKLTVLGVKYVAELFLDASVSGSVGFGVTQEGYRDEIESSLILTATCGAVASGGITGSVGAGYVGSVSGKLQGELKTEYYIPLNDKAVAGDSKVTDANLKAVGKATILGELIILKKFEWTLWSAADGSSNYKEDK